jgi:pyruvate kinase
VLEGADAFCLCHETSIGKNPIESVVQLSKAIAEGENIIDYEQAYGSIRQDSISNAKRLSPVDILATTACSIALNNNVDIFICLT